MLLNSPVGMGLIVSAVVVCAIMIGFLRHFRPLKGTFGKYEIESLLHPGPRAELYVARDNEAGEPVVLKVLRPERWLPGRWGYRQKSIDQFFEESEILKDLNKHHRRAPIVRYREEGFLRRNGRPYLALQYVPGKPLSESLAQGAPLSVPTIRGIVGFVANALRCCHNLGVYHWDLSPNNVLVEFEESDPERVRALWLIDFNASKSSHVGGTTRAATECHAAPEQFPPYSSHRYTDYFLLGIIVYQMWVGKRPFHNFEAIKKGTFDPEPLGPPDSPVRQAVEALLNQDPDQRPRGLSLLLQALNVNPRDYDLPEPVYRRARLPSPDWGRRMALGSVALLALIGAMVVWTRGPQQDRPDLSLPTEAIVSASDVEAPPAGPETPEKDLLPPALPGPTEISARLQPPPQTMPTQRSGQIGRGADEPSRPQPTTRPLRRPSPPMRTKRRIPESPLPRQKVTPPEVTTLIRTIPPTPSEVTTPPSEVTTPPSEVTMPPSEVTAPPPKVTTTSPKVIAPPPKVTTTPPAREVSDEKTTELRSGESLP